MPPSLNPDLHDTQSGPSPARWGHEILRRLRHHFVLKFLGISGFMSLFFQGYFYLLLNPARPVTVMPLTALDHWITFQPSALAAYLSLWFYVGIPAGLMASLRQLVVYGAWVAALCLTGLACFYVFPTAVPAPLSPVDVAQHPAFGLLQGVDAAGNASPSLHVASAVFSALWIERLLREVGAPWPARATNGVWVTLIVYSTLAVKQHVVLDAVAGTLLALPFAWASLRFFPWTRLAR